MNVLLKLTVLCGFLSLANGTALAQSQSSPCGAARGSFSILHATSSTGCPFSATVEILRTQTLSDGTHIQTRTKTLVYRDSFGRISSYGYQSVGLDDPDPDSPNFIQIYDPVAGFTYLFLPQRSNTAMRSQLRRPGSPLSPSAHQAPPQPEPKFTFERLGTQSMLGLSVTGEKMTRTFPVGMIHNDRPITVVYETWSSPELGLVLLRKTSDPRSSEDGEIRVTDLELSEPDASLFELPAGTVIQDPPPRQ
jgi:hypothetical protein